MYSISFIELYQQNNVIFIAEPKMSVHEEARTSDRSKEMSNVHICDHKHAFQQYEYFHKSAHYHI